VAFCVCPKALLCRAAFVDRAEIAFSSSLTTAAAAAAVDDFDAKWLWVNDTDRLAEQSGMNDDLKGQ
jgi:hypothetical protein